MIRYFLIFFTFTFAFSFQTFAEETKIHQLKNKISFFTQDVFPEFSLPRRLSELKEVAIQLTLPTNPAMPSLRKVYDSEFQFENLSFKIAVYFFYQNKERYFSQQVSYYRKGKLIARCTSYFPESQGFLVPGVCSGVDDEAIWGLSIFKG